MKRILGLDLGSTSIGWAIIDENSEEITNADPSVQNQDKIIARAHNTRVSEKQVFTHAEIKAINKACKKKSRIFKLQLFFFTRIVGIIITRSNLFISKSEAINSYHVNIIF